MEKIPYRLRKAIEKQVSKNTVRADSRVNRTGDAQRTAVIPNRKCLPAMQSGGGIRYAFRLLFCTSFQPFPVNGMRLRKG